ncbi:MAG: amidohydrolase family protein [Spirochaetales bacterium]|nr:amidohydrolase family protein [Spirochaetales bacterium]
MNKRLRNSAGAVFLAGLLLLLTAFTLNPEIHPHSHEETNHAESSPAELPIIDTHVHYKQPAWSLYSPAEVIELFRKSGVVAALVSSSPDEGTRMLYEEAPDMIIPFLRPYHNDVTSGNWFQKPFIVDYLVKRLERPIYKGIGEFHIHSSANADSPMIKETVRLAVQENLYIHVHTNHEAVEKLFELEPDVKILWAHAGMSDPPSVISDMFDRYENLWTDISIREREIAPGGILDPDWEALFLRHPDRITIGSDTWVNSQWERYESIISFDREWLNQLPDDTARMIAYGNAERLFR